MLKKCSFILFLALLWQMPVTLGADEPPQHFVNPVENLHEDPNYVPRDYPIPDFYPAQATYLQKRTEMMPYENVTKGNKVFTLGLGEVSAVSTKDKMTKVFGYFRNYLGVAEMGALGVKKMEMIIDMNSYDTGVPGRNHRILALFFDSINPQTAVTTVTFTEFNYGEKTFSEIGNGETHKIQASGEIVLNQMPKPITASLNVKNDAGTWTIETAEPIVLLISDFAFHNKPFDLMKECNHKFLDNAVEVNVKLVMR